MTNNEPIIEFHEEPTQVAEIRVPEGGNDLCFNVNGRERLRIAADGGFYVDGEKVNHSGGTEVYEAVREFFNVTTKSMRASAESYKQEIRNALGAATPGPWELKSSYYGGMRFDVRSARFDVRFYNEADAHLIANAPTWLRELVDDNDRLRHELYGGLTNEQG